jgi:hypothetical protein
MRMMPTRYALPKAATIKKQVAEIEHVQPPLKGLSLATRNTPGDPQSATILQNFTIEDDRIQVRAGYRKKATRGTAPVWHLIPYYGAPTALLAASNHELWNALSGALVRGGFTSDDWHWTSFSNLSQVKYSVMVNGADGVWSWDGGFTASGATVNVTTVTKAASAVITVSNIAGFTNGMSVNIYGATGTWAVINGVRTISSVGTPANSFTIAADTTAATGTVNAGVTATPAGSIVHETVSARASDPWVVPAQFQIVVSHQNRLWFADNANLAVYYLPIQTKSGEVTPLPLNAIFRRGGSIRAMATWTMDGGRGMDDNLVIFSTNGEAVIYSGTDPDSVDAWQLVGVFHFDSPMSKHCVVNYGGDLYVLISTGLVPMTTLIRAETEQLGQIDRNVISVFLKDAIKYRNNLGWQTFLNPSSGRLFCNMPQGSTNVYKQLVRHMPRAIWSEFQGVPARCWNWIDPIVYFGDDKGNVFEMHPAFLNDDGQPILADVMMAWNQFKTPAKKHFTMIQAYMITDGDPRPVIDINVDYDDADAVNTPDISFAQGGALWNVTDWNAEYWATDSQRVVTLWNGVAPLGRVGAVRTTVKVHNCIFAIAGWDVSFERGSIL